MLVLLLYAAVGVAPANAAVLRSNAKVAKPAMKPAAKVRHLVLDIEESVRKAGEDSEMVYSTLFTYDGQLESSLKREIGTLNQTLAKLEMMKTTYSSDIRNSHTKLANLGTAAQNSQMMATKYEKGTAQTASRFENLEENVHMLVSLLKNAGVTPQGKIVTPETPDERGEPARVYAAIRRLLLANQALRLQHPNVFAAFLTPIPQSNGPPSDARYPVVRMTQGLMQDTIHLLEAVQQRLGTMKSQALLQFDSLHRRFEKAAVFNGANAEAQQGLEAENEQKAAELSFSIKFTTSVLKIDREFYESLQSHLKSNSDLIFAVRDLRQAQLKILRDLTGILGAEGAIATGGLSFLETKSETTGPRTIFAGLQAEAETAIQNHGDTHAILMRVKEELDAESPIDESNVRSTMVEMQDVLRNIEHDQTKFQAAKRGCESQEFHAKEEEEGLKANLALMSAARDHAQKAITAAQTNVKGIEKKRLALGKSSTDFSRISEQAIKSLEGQSKDRKTIVMAVRKAAEVVGPTLPAGVSTVQLMQSLLQDLEAQDAKEASYRAHQSRFRAEFFRYVQDYSQLLDERQRHYQSALGVLQLHVSELASDLLAQQQTLRTGEELSTQSSRLCQSILRFHDKHQKTRASLSATLRSILPNMPTVLSGAVIGNEGDA